tara:strand:+ start:5341 stop:5784 length:444 start_codon:yes stop_codon:yes gene_type:complete
MERREFIKNTCLCAIGIPLGISLLESCSLNYYAKYSKANNQLVVPLNEFVNVRNTKEINRKYVLIDAKVEGIDFPICLYKKEENKFVASLLKCTHRGCELNVGGGIYTCPCHGSEFTIEGEVIEGPAEEKLKIFKTTIDNENIYVYL